MSKVDAMRALKQARLEHQRRTAPARPPSETVAAACGHRNMGGRSCTRPLGHDEKSHRYG